MTHWLYKKIPYVPATEVRQDVPNSRSIENAVLHPSARVQLIVWFRYILSVDQWAGFDFVHVGGYCCLSSESGAGTEVTPVERARQRQGGAVSDSFDQHRDPS